MNNLSLRITDHRTGFDQTVAISSREIVVKPLTIELAGFDTQASPHNETLVPADTADMADALTQLSQELGCANTLDDMLHAIDALRSPRAVCGQRFIDNDDGTITDTVNRLMWSKATNTDKCVNHKTAEEACAQLQLGGHSDWRLPTRTELLTLVDDTRHQPAIDTDVLQDTKSDWYWTSTITAWASSCAWIVFFSIGSASYGHRDYNLAFARAVRSLPAGQ